MNLKQYKSARIIRDFEELLLKLFSQGKLNGTVHTCVGQEVIPVLLAENTTTEDVYISNHRGHGHYISKTGDVKGLLFELLGKKRGCSGGYGGSQHLYKEKEFYSNGIQGGMTPVAAGIAMAKKNLGEKGIVVQFIGDGTLGEGLLYETMNCAKIFQLPLLIILENNGYAQSTSFKQTFGGDLAKRVEGFGFKYFNGNIWELDKLGSIINQGVKLTREFTPVFIEINCYRLNSHSKGDDNRDIEEINNFIKLDPINVFENQFPDEAIKVKTEHDLLLNSLLENALEEESLFNVSSETISLKMEGMKFNNYNNDENLLNKRYNELIYESFINQIQREPYTVFLGEDIQNKTQFTSKDYGGAFKVTKNLSDLSNYVYNTPISEAAITGIGIGLSLFGVSCVVEIMFGDFMTLTFDQILQHASKFQGMYGQRIKMPFILRTPMGGRRGYGPTHSQSLEKHFLGIFGVNVIALNYRLNPDDIYKKIFKNQIPTIVIENKIDYTRYLQKDLIITHDYFISNDDFPVILIKPKHTKPSVSILCYGGTLFDIENAASDLLIYHEIAVEIICYSEISNCNLTPIYDSVITTRKLITIEEGSSFAAFGSEVISQLITKGSKIEKMIRIGNAEIIPSSYEAELNLLPSKEKIISEILKM